MDMDIDSDTAVSINLGGPLKGVLGSKYTTVSHSNL